MRRRWRRTAGGRRACPARCPARPAGAPVPVPGLLGGRVTASWMPHGEGAGLRQALVAEQLGETARVALADGPDLPAALPAVQLQRDDGRLGVQTGEREAGDLRAVGGGDGGEGGRGGAEAVGSATPLREGEQHVHQVHLLGDGVQIDMEAQTDRGPAGHLDTREDGRTGVRDPLGAAYGALRVAERGAGHDRRPGRHPDLQSGPGQGVILPRDQLGRHRLCPLVSSVKRVGVQMSVFRCRWSPGAEARDAVTSWCGRATTRRSGSRRPRPALAGPGPGQGLGVAVSGLREPERARGIPRRRNAVSTAAAGSTASGPGTYGRWPGCPGPSSASPRPPGAPSP